jgi:hypothetical protein
LIFFYNILIKSKYTENKYTKICKGINNLDNEIKEWLNNKYCCIDTNIGSFSNWSFLNNNTIFEKINTMTFSEMSYLFLTKFTNLQKLTIHGNNLSTFYKTNPKLQYLKIYEGRDYNKGLSILLIELNIEVCANVTNIDKLVNLKKLVLGYNIIFRTKNLFVNNVIMTQLMNKHIIITH